MVIVFLSLAVALGMVQLAFSKKPNTFSMVLLGFNSAMLIINIFKEYI